MLPVDLGAVWRLTFALAIGGGLTLALDRLVRPDAPGMRREWPAVAIALGLHGLLLGLALLVVRRPLFACALALAAQMLVIQVSNAKFRALREPFVFTDFGLFAQALRHPRLYLPFLGITRALVAAAGFAAAVVLGVVLEPALNRHTGYAFVVMAVAATVLSLGTLRAAAATLNPVADLRRWGLLPSIWLYSFAALGRARMPAPRAWRAPGRGSANPLPDLVVVESESFFDVRRLHPAIRPEVLRNFDEMRREAMLAGRLSVPAWGANTMRTEFAFLTGLGEEALGIWRFNPYRLAARAPMPALPAYLRSLGYRTVCIHPHPASFFERHRVMPKLGFDVFLDLAAFPDAPRAGPYVADAAVADRIAQVLEQADAPTLVFAITMENHGPLHLERASPEDELRFYAEPPPKGLEDLTVYLRHLANADSMIATLRRVLSSRARPGVLCFFGDHVPSMPKVYDALGFPDGRTDYLIWRGGGTGTERELGAEDLAAAMIDCTMKTHEFAAARGDECQPSKDRIG